MKKTMSILMILCCLTLLSGCTVTDGAKTPTTSADPTISTTTTTTAFVGGIGGDEYFFSRSYISEFSVESAQVALVDKAQYNAWCNTFEHFDAGGTRDQAEYNVYTLIKEFDIPREEIEGICDWYASIFDGDEYLTDEQVEMLYTGTEEEVYQYFANPYAVLVGKKAYSPKWMVQHTAEEYVEIGITYELLQPILHKVKIPCTEEQRTYLDSELLRLKTLENRA